MKKTMLFALSLILAFAAPICAQAQKAAKLVIAGRDGDYGNAMQVAVDAYKVAHPEVTIELLKLSGDDIYQKTVIDLKTGSGSYDLILIDDPKAMQFQKAGWLEDLGPLYKKAGQKVDPDFIASAMDLCRFPNGASGKLYGLPFVGNVSLFAYRQDLFKKYGLGDPRTWTDVLTAAKKISAGEGEAASAVVFRGVKGNPIVTAYLPIFWAFGGEILDKSGKPTLDSPAGMKAISYFLELAKYAPKGTPMNNTAQVRDTLLAGGAAIAPEVWPAWLGAMEDPSKSKVAGLVKVAKHPGEVTKSASMIGIWHIAIPAASRSKQAAFDFLQFVTSKEIQKKMSVEVGLPPSRSSIYDDPEILKLRPWYPAIRDALANGKARPRTLYWAEIENTLGGYLQQALIGEKTGEAALREANQKIAEAIK
ncbi:MAG TPA: ABC transporter substrate-binding protein [Spirochaetales bacterium]|nr:ABC transporter substrate-binding protein [Spirochaetales bacterium]HRY55657.1 ABC transporter substrate-binding protein [Spirochaetia bacterium]HRZ63539.1 ABC transporter substrate-binding protein [Spirochaetia bacterium]